MLPRLERAPSSSESLGIILPGVADKADMKNIVALKADIETQLDMDVIVHDIFSLPGVKEAREPDENGKPIYYCNWTPSEYMHSIQQLILEQVADGKTHVELFGHSYGGDIALLLGIIDGALAGITIDPHGDNPVVRGTWGNIKGITVLMPTQFLASDRYNEERSFKHELAILQYPRSARSHLRTYEQYPINPNEPEEDKPDYYTVIIDQHVIESHVTPWRDLFMDSGRRIKTRVVNLAQSGLLKEIKARTHIINSRNDTLYPTSFEDTKNTYLSLEGDGHKYTELNDIGHGYRAYPRQIQVVGKAVVGGLVEFGVPRKDGYDLTTNSESLVAG